MVSADRQQVIETNRSLRTIKTVRSRLHSLPLKPNKLTPPQELEALLEKGVLSEDAFDNIQRLLPAEGTLGNRSGASALPTPATTPSATAHHAPPSYALSTGNSTAAPPLPGRKQPPPATKPVVAHARALYTYSAQDSRDCSFEKGDRLAVHEKMNADWWLGVNERTGEEGIFPKAYVEEENATAGWGGEKAGYQAPQQQYGGAYPPPPGQVNAYNSHAPPMAMANGEGGVEKPSKTEENGKKFGKKLGNAAIFGAGATLGGKIVNSIF
jgi:hypothetical protein